MNNDPIYNNKNWLRGIEYLGCKFPIVGGAMSWVSNHTLVAAISNSGGFGVIACGGMLANILDIEIKKTKSLTKKNFGVNLIVLHPHIDLLIDICIKHNISHVVFSGGIVRKEHVQLLNKNNCKVIAIVPTLSIAKRLIGYGVSGLIIEGMEAGGHIGKVGTIVLVQEILPYIKDIPVFVAGGIGHGSIIKALISIGASGCQIGTLFACSKESIVHKKCKQIMIQTSSRGTVTSKQINDKFPVIPVRSINNKANKDFIDFQVKIIDEYQKGSVELKSAILAIEQFWVGALKKAVIDGDIDNGSLMSGQIVGLIKQEKSVQQIIDDLLKDIENC